MNMRRAGIKVVDLTRILSGRFCTMMLRDMGADPRYATNVLRVRNRAALNEILNQRLRTEPTGSAA